jgi:hypothetical protein
MKISLIVGLVLIGYVTATENVRKSRAHLLETVIGASENMIKAKEAEALYS